MKQDFNFLKVINESDDLYNEFYRMADTLFNEFAVFVENGDIFFLVDIEFYLLSSWHQDFYTYGHPEQLGFGQWFKHASGMDFVFGDSEKSVYAGILIRGIQKVYDRAAFINGPINVRDALSQKDHTVTSRDLNDKIKLKKRGIKETRQVFISGRVGLTCRSIYEHHKRMLKSENGFDKTISLKHESFITRRYRFLTEICSKNQFKEKARVQALSVDADISHADEINKIFCS